jgi:5-formyltetrahydrofolate cyclo-ligase
MNKHEHRKWMKEKLSAIPSDAFTDKSLRLSKNLDSLLSDLHVIQKNICIGAFAPIEKEPLWFSALSEKYQTAYPTFDTTKAMHFKLASISDLIERKDFGPKILGPADNAKEVIPGVVLIPGLVFTAHGERLGRGKGFYDRYLHNFSGIKIGIAFAFQVEENLHTEEHDVPLDFIVTEEKIIDCKLLQTK